MEDVSGQLEKSKKSRLPSIGLDALIGIEEDECRPDLGEKVKSIISTYERGLYYRREKREKKPPIDIYTQMVKELRMNLSFEEYKEVVEALVDELVETLRVNPFLHVLPYQHSLETASLKNVYTFVTLALVGE